MQDCNYPGCPQSSNCAPSMLQPAPPPPPPAPGKGRFFAGFSIGCFTAIALLIFIIVAPFIAVMGSCSTLIDSSLKETASFRDELQNMGSDELPPAKRLVTAGDNEEGKYIAVISVNGIIGRDSMTSFMGDESGASAKRICKLLKYFTEEPDEDLAAIIIDMDTPGGEVVASDEIRAALDALPENIPVVTCIHTMGASGGYYIASGSDWIIANRVSITGSVGVIIGGYQISELMSKIGVKPMVYRSGAFKDIGSSMREPTDAESEYMNELVQETFTRFCEVVSKGRPRYFPTANAVKNSPFGDGRPVSGERALEYHLIDELGDLDSAIAKARELSKADNAPVYRISASVNWRERFFGLSSRTPSLKIEGITPAQLPAGKLYFLMP